MRLQYDTARGHFDLALTPAGGLDAGIGNGGALEASVWVSLFTDALADLDDMPPDLGTDRRGWWADAGRAAEDSMGSRIWLHRREKRTEAARLAVERAAQAAVDWLARDGLASSVAVTATLPDRPRDAIALQVVLVEPNGVRRDWKVDLLWSGLAH